MTGEKKPISGEKKVDERWKEEVEKDKRHVGRQAGEAGKKREASPPANFSHFISGLAIQGMIFLGEVENPATGKKEKQLEQAKYIIDTLDILKGKTKGNLTTAEETTMDNLLYDLRMRYLKAVEQED